MHIDKYRLYTAQWQSSTNNAGSDMFILSSWTENRRDGYKVRRGYKDGKPNWVNVAPDYMMGYLEGCGVPETFYYQDRTYKMHIFDSLQEAIEAAEEFSRKQQRSWERVLHDKVL